MLTADNIRYIAELRSLEPSEPKPEPPPLDEDRLYEEYRDERAAFEEHFWSGEGIDLNGFGQEEKFDRV